MKPAARLELERLKARTSSGFYCGSCRTRTKARCRCVLGCTVALACRNGTSYE